MHLMKYYIFKNKFLSNYLLFIRTTVIWNTNLIHKVQNLATTRALYECRMCATVVWKTYSLLSFKKTDFAVPLPF